MLWLLIFMHICIAYSENILHNYALSVNICQILRSSLHLLLLLGLVYAKISKEKILRKIRERLTSYRERRAKSREGRASRHKTELY